MLGDQIGELAGQITGMRVLPDEGTGPRFEVSYQASGTLLGAHVSDMGTSVTVARPDGTLFCDGQGVIKPRKISTSGSRRLRHRSHYAGRQDRP